MKRQGVRVFSLLLMVAVLMPRIGLVISIRGDKPYEVELRSWYDAELGHRQWVLNLGPTGIRAVILPDTPDRFVVEHVFQDETSPARGKVEKGDVIVGAVRIVSSI